MASMATTTHCWPNLSESRFTRLGFSTAAVFMDTLSAPLMRASLASLIDLIPPPTVNGMFSSDATAFIILLRSFRRSGDAVMSRKTSSSAPSSLYFFPSSAGSPASVRFLKWIPLTTLPRSTSRHGMILFERTISTFLLSEYLFERDLAVVNGSAYDSSPSSYLRQIVQIG